jgi:hypothetical protein
VTGSEPRKIVGIGKCSSSRPTSKISQVTSRGSAGTRSANRRPVSGPFRAEESGDCPAVAKLNDRWHVIRCKDGIQWVLQRRRGAKWRGAYYCRSREGLLFCVREYVGVIDGMALAILLRLPARIGGDQ